MSAIATGNGNNKPTQNVWMLKHTMQRESTKGKGCWFWSPQKKKYEVNIKCVVYLKLWFAYLKHTFRFSICIAYLFSSYYIDLCALVDFSVYLSEFNAMCVSFFSCSASLFIIITIFSLWKCIRRTFPWSECQFTVISNYISMLNLCLLFII